MIKELMSTPIINQYLTIKKLHENCLLLFRLGDFYELFYEDAKIAAEILNITLTKRAQKDEDIPMAGIPYHACDHYIAKLVAAGKKVAICEQNNNLLTNDKIIHREVIRIITPGTLTDDNLLDSKRNNYLLAIFGKDLILSCGVFDLSTNEFNIEEISSEHLKNFLEKIEPSEILINQNWLSRFPDYETWKNKITFTQEISFSTAQDIILKFFKLHSNESINYFSNENKVTIAMIIEYIKLTQKVNNLNIKIPTKNIEKDEVSLDLFTRRNLEITKTLQNNLKGSLLWFLDQTKTAQGARALFKYITKPIKNIEKLNTRYDNIEFFMKNKSLLEITLKQLELIPDFERILSKIFFNRSSPHELRKLALGIKNLSILCKNIKKPIEDHENLTNEILNAISEDAAVNNFKEKPYIKDGYDNELDSWKKFEKEIDEQILNLQTQYQNETKVSNLRIKFTTLGYLIEINNNQKDKLGYNFLLKQNLKTASRYTTQQLELINNKFSECSEFIKQKEQEIFETLSKKIIEIANDIYLYSEISAELDLFSNLSNISLKNNYIRPILTQNNEFIIQNGVHPILNKILKEKGMQFVENDCNLTQPVIFMTGPNMAGKSTYLRQQALICLLSHIGMFVPATYAKIGIVDQIFSRISTYDDSMQGNSTFMIEMIEIALTINQATNKSFLILDEVGRGTSVEEGESLAYSILQYLLNKLKARTLFSTHYLTLAQNIEHENLNKKMMEIKENPIHFTYKIINGISKKSYALEVAKIAGMPKEIIDQAELYLNQKN